MMYYKWIETDAAAKAKYNETASKASAERMKVVRKKAAGIRRAKKSLA
jgi:hypothetical protein